MTPALELTPLPNAPAIVMGIFNLRGLIVPVMNLRRRLALPERELQLDDKFIVAQSAGRTVALVVDDTNGLVEASTDEIVPTGDFLSALPHVAGVIRLKSGIALIHDLAQFLSLDETRQLDCALGEGIKG